MDPLLITGASLGALLLLTSSLWWRARRGRRRARRTAAGLQSDLTATRRSLESLRVGEREAAWAATATARRLDRTMVDLGKSTHEANRLEGDVDELRTRLGTADRELDRLRTDHDEASTRVAILESDLDRSKEESAGAAQQLDSIEQRLNAVVKERDRLSATAQQTAQLEAELAALGRVHKELTAARTENAALRIRLATPATGVPGGQAHLERLQREIAELRSQLTEADSRIADTVDELRLARQKVTELEAGLASQPQNDHLVASEAARNDLERQLAALTAARSAEQQASTDRISKLDLLYHDIAERDRRILELEEEIDEISTARDAALGDGARLETPTYAGWDRTLRERVAASVREATERLRDQVDHLRIVIAEKERLLQETGRKTAVAARGPIPVTTIKGIGPVIASILSKHGIDSVKAVAALSESDIDRLGEEMPVYPGRIRRDDWVGQARALTS